MKKLKKLSVFALLAVGFALVFGGCSNADDETKTEQGGGGDDTDKKEEGKDEEKDPASSEKTGIIIGEKEYAFSELTIKDAYCGTYDGENDVVAEKGELIISISKDGVLTMAGYQWDKTYLTFSQAVDLSSFSKMTIEAKVSDGYKAGDAVIFEVSSSDKAASGVNTWTDKTFFGDLTTSFKSFSIGMDKFQCLKNNSVYCKDDHSKDKDDEVADKCTFTNAADMKAIKEIAINPRGASGNIYIKSIKFE